MNFNADFKHCIVKMKFYSYHTRATPVGAHHIIHHYKTISFKHRVVKTIFQNHKNDILDQKYIKRGSLDTRHIFKHCIVKTIFQNHKNDLLHIISNLHQTGVPRRPAYIRRTHLPSTL